MTKQRGMSIRGPIGWGVGNKPADLSKQDATRRDREGSAGKDSLMGIPCISPNCSTVASIQGSLGEPLTLCIRAPFVCPDETTYVLTGDRAVGHGSLLIVIDAMPEQIEIICRRQHRTPIARKGLQAAATTLRIGAAAQAAE